MSFAQVGEEDAGGDKGDDGGGLVGLRPDDARTRGPEKCGDGEDTVKPVGGRCVDPADASGAGRQKSGPQRAQKKPGEQMKAQVLPGGKEPSAQLGAAYREPEKADAEEKECDGRSDGEKKIPNFKNGDGNGEAHPESVDER